MQCHQLPGKFFPGYIYPALGLLFSNIASEKSESCKKVRVKQEAVSKSSCGSKPYMSVEISSLPNEKYGENLPFFSVFDTYGDAISCRFVSGRPMIIFKAEGAGSSCFLAGVQIDHLKELASFSSYVATASLFKFSKRLGEQRGRSATSTEDFKIEKSHSLENKTISRHYQGKSVILA